MTFKKERKPKINKLMFFIKTLEKRSKISLKNKEGNNAIENRTIIGKIRAIKIQFLKNINKIDDFSQADKEKKRRLKLLKIRITNGASLSTLKK